MDDAELFLHNTLFSILRLHVPERTLHERISAHPWGNERCLLAIRSKHASQGTDEFSSTSATCSATLFEEYLEYIKRMRDKLRKEKLGSKGWWRATDRIMDKQDRELLQFFGTQMQSGCVIRLTTQTYLRARFP